MRKHLVTEQLRAYGQHRLSPAELIEADAHLAECEACRQRLETALPASTVALYAAWQNEPAWQNEADSPAHLSFEQLAAFVEQTLNHAETHVVSDHVATCGQCAFAVNDLRRFAATDAPRPVGEAVKGKTSWWESVREWVAVPSFGWAIAALLLVVLAGWLMRALWQRPVEAPQLARQENTPTPLPVLSPEPTASESVPLLAQLPVLQLNDGGRQITLDQQGRLSGVEALSAAQQQAVKNALTTQRLERSGALADLQRRGSSLMGADDQGQRFALKAPVSKVVLSDRPTFKWSPLSGTASYVVEIYDEQFNLVAQSESLPQNQWTPLRPLTRGKVFAWQVKAIQNGQTIMAPAPPAPQARIRTVASTQVEEISRAKRTGSHLTLGLIYVQAGLLDEAETEFRMLRQANPDSEAARRWLSQVQAMRR